MFTERYKKNAVWTASRQSISEYRTWEQDMVPCTDSFWFDPEFSELMDFLLEGKIPSESQLSQLPVVAFGVPR